MYSNVALEKPAYQSSTQNFRQAAIAVDGVKRYVCPSSLTHRDKPAWWMVDLQGQFVVKRIIIATSIFTGNGIYILLHNIVFVLILCFLNNVSQCVAVKNPTYTFSEHRLGKFSVLIGNMFEGNHLIFSNFKQCINISGFLGEMEIKHPCGMNVSGRYAAVHLIEVGILSICELEVYGGKLNKHCPKYTTLTSQTLHQKLQREW